MKLLRIEGSKRIRLLPWRYDEPGFLVRQVMLRGREGSCVVKFDRDNPTFLSPHIYGAPDPLWDMRRPGEPSVMSWQWFIAPCYEPGENEVKLVRLPSTVYHQIIVRITGTPHPPLHSELIVERLDEMPGDMTLAEALAAANPPPEDEWLEEPLDVTDLDEGCDIILRKLGRGITTRWEVTFAEPAPVMVVPEICDQMKDLKSFDVLPELEEHCGAFDLELYLEGCRRNKTIVTDAVREKLEAISS